MPKSLTSLDHIYHCVGFTRSRYHACCQRSLTLRGAWGTAAFSPQAGLGRRPRRFPRMRGAVSQVEKVFSVINSTRLLLLLSALSVPPLWLCRAASTVGGEIAAIRPVEHPPRAAKPGGVVAVLNEPEMPVRGAKSSPRTIAKILSGAGIEVELLSAKQLADPDVLRPSAFDLVVLPTGQSFRRKRARRLSTSCTMGAGSFRWAATPSAISCWSTTESGLTQPT